jgi:cytochrome c peroxidase
VFNTAQFWDGRAKDLEAQAGGPMVNPVEMASPAAHVAEQLGAIPGYVPAFKAAFPGESLPVSLGNAQKAIAVFEATLITPNSAFDKFLGGQSDALTAQQKSGLKLFMDKGCAACHNGINIGGGMYAPFGVVEKPDAALLPPGDAGRFVVTKAVGDEFVFKVPTLRNITLTAPYFHTGKSWDLRQAIAVMAKSQLGANLSGDEIDLIVSFLDSLTGQQPSVVYPTLPPNVTSSPHPDK